MCSSAQGGASDVQLVWSRNSRNDPTRNSNEVFMPRFEFCHLRLRNVSSRDPPDARQRWKTHRDVSVLPPARSGLVQAGKEITAKTKPRAAPPSPRLRTPPAFIPESNSLPGTGGHRRNAEEGDEFLGKGSLTLRAGARPATDPAWAAPAGVPAIKPRLGKPGKEGRLAKHSPAPRLPTTSSRPPRRGSPRNASGAGRNDNELS